MLIRTHLTITLFFVLLFFNSVEHKIIFAVVSLIATFLPDVDSRFSKIGRKKILRPMQFFSGHRKIFHSFIFLILVSFGLYFISESVFLGFLFGYGIHIFSDGLTRQGVQIFYPFEIRVRGFIKTGGIIENILLICFIFADAMVILMMFFRIYS